MSLLFVESLIFVVSILLMAFVTAAEVALSSFGENKIDELKEKGDNIWKLFAKVQQNPEPYLTVPPYLWYYLSVINYIYYLFCCGRFSYKCKDN